MKLFDGRSEFYQYDTNQKLICDGCAVGEEIHFSNGFYSKAAICNTYDFEGSVVVNVPNSYLLHSGDLTVYRMCVDSEGRNTIEQCVFRVNARKKPSDYVYTETEVKSYKALEDRIEKLEKGGGSGGIGSPMTRIAEIELIAEKWVGNASPYSQVVDVPTATIHSQVDLTPSVEQLAIFHNKDLAFVAENEDGVVTVYAIGDKPANDYTMQVTIKEVSA